MLLHKNTVNQFVVTGRERSLIYASGGTPYYLMSIKSQSTNIGCNVIIPILSSCTRYDLCQLTITGSGQSNLTAGTITGLTQVGNYNYCLYEQSVIDLTNTQGHLLEVGMFYLSGNPINTTYTYNNGESINVFY